MNSDIAEALDHTGMQAQQESTKRVRPKLSLVKFFHPPGGWRKRFTPMQWTSNGTANITDNLDVKFSRK